MIPLPVVRARPRNPLVGDRITSVHSYKRGRVVAYTADGVRVEMSPADVIVEVLS
ncbi:hypothetical protein [Gordonia caeni]|uniref:Uncharacterized protein n=1 Tax=Gordonia caeni TaxID=1007097 RepID=A0ABP7PBA3_9ACTN